MIRRVYQKWWVAPCVGLCLLCVLPVASADTMTYQIEGVQGAVKENIDDRLKIERDDLGKNLTRGKVLGFLHAIPAAIKRSAAPFGYFSPRIYSDIQNNSGRWAAKFKVVLGKPVRVNDVIIDLHGAGADKVDFKNLVTDFPLKPGMILKTDLYKKGKQSFADLAAYQGYFDAKFEKSQLTIDTKRRTAAVRILFDTGGRYRFGPASIKAGYFDMAFLRRFINYTVGEGYTNEKVTAMQQAFTSSNYFDSVFITPQVAKRHNSKREIPINIVLKQSKAWQLQYGAGYGTDTGVRGQISVKQTRFTKTGHHFDASIRASQKETYVVSRYHIPGKNPATDDWVLGVGMGEQKWSDAKSETHKVSVAYNSTVYGFKQGVSISYVDEKYTLPKIVPFSIETQMIMPVLTWSRLVQDQAMRPTKGYMVSLKLSGANRHWLASKSFGQAILQAKFLHTVHKDTRIILRTRIGRTDIGDLRNLPLSLQLFAGGASSVRGYSYKQFGPGRNLLVVSGELQQRIKGDWYLAGFYDAGNVDDSVHMRLNQGVGAGVVWLSPVGALEITAAKALDAPKKPWKIQFEMGPVL